MNFIEAACSALIVLGAMQPPSPHEVRVVQRRFAKHLEDAAMGRVTHPRTVPYGSVSKRPVDSRLGFADTTLDRAALILLSRVGLPSKSGMFLDIGTGYGLVAHHAVHEGAPLVLAGDLSTFQLARAYYEAPPEARDHMVLIRGAFPTQFPPRLDELPFTSKQGALRERLMPELQKSAGLIFMGRVAHLMPPHVYEEAARLMYEFSAEDGVIMVTASSPHNKKFAGFSDDYNARVDAGDPDPGFMRPADYLPPDLASDYPEYMNFLDPVTIQRPLRKAKFFTEASYYEEPRSRGDLASDDMRFKGRERVWALGWKQQYNPPFRKITMYGSDGRYTTRKIPTRD